MSSELLSFIFRYLNGLCTLDELESWLLANLQEILDSDDPADIEMANKIDADLLELAEGLIDDAEFIQHLQVFLTDTDTMYISTPSANYSFVTGSLVTTYAEYAGSLFNPSSHQEEPSPVQTVCLEKVLVQ